MFGHSPYSFLAAPQEFRRSFLGFPDGTIDVEDLFIPLDSLQHVKPSESPHGVAGVGGQTSENRDLDGREIDDREGSSVSPQSPGKKIFLKF